MRAAEPGIGLPAVQHDDVAPERALDLPTHLLQRRRALLARWRRRARADPGLTTADGLTRRQFEDHVPEVIEALVDRLRRVEAHGTPDGAEVPGDASVDRWAEDHGLHRWQQGYDQRETIREWRHLQHCLLEETDAYAAAAPDDAETVARARIEVAALCMDGVERSASEFMRMHRAEAASRIGDLEAALAHLSAIERQRLDTIRETAHDLRGNVGTLRTVSSVLGRPDVTVAAREAATGALHRGVAALHELLTDLLDLSRLEAGLERRADEPFDAAQLLDGMCAALGPIATERGLYLRRSGADTLPVQGDPVKVLRIAQNLVHNALNCTTHGGVDVGCDEHEQADGPPRWVMTIRDTGPGLPQAGEAPIADALEHATHEAQAVDAAGAGALPAAPPRDGRGRAAGAGEGLGLTIVKRLCELLDAAMALESAPGAGTAFRITFPKRAAPRAD